MNKLQKEYADFERKNKALFKKVSDEIISKITPDTPLDEVDRIVKAAYKKYNIDIESFNLMMDSIVATVLLGIGKDKATTTKINAIKRWYLDKAYSASGRKFSSTINDLNRVSEVVADIKESLRLTRTWKQTADSLVEKGIQKADIAKDIQAILEKARKVYGLTDDSIEYKKYRKAVQSVQRRIDNMVDPSTSKLKRAYQDILDITNTSSLKQIDNATKYASYFKERYNAERIARTEMADAYGKAFDVDNITDEDSIGVRWVLSSGHPEPDICNFNAEADLYGMGPGGYPKEHYPVYPAHPNCMCGLEKIIVRSEPENTKSDYNSKKAESYLNKLPESEKEKLLGVKGAEEFNKNPKTWQKNLKSWQPHEDKKVVIPKDVLYGK